ncbi:MAG TPA: GMC family oxidoreductase N-terminal domain-containing protein [Streptosporangiaceae bacterium]
MDEFDFIVIGAGTAGCVLAARLSEDPGARVLLLEAGGQERTHAMTVPNAWPGNLGSAADWGQATTAQADGEPAPYPRGKALGGSSAINAMAHVRGHRSCYDGWAAAGLAGWGFADLLPYFRRSERADGRDPALRGTEGPVRVAPVPPGERHPVASRFAEALVTAGYPATDDLSGAQPEGVAWPDLAISGGERVSAADAYLRPAMDRPSLTVRTDCLVTGLEIRNGRCTGVSYARGGQAARARAGREVVMCAGAIGTPQILLLSGIGPADELRTLGIDPVADLPGVGENLHDHSLAMLSYAAAGPLPASRYNHGEMYAALRSDWAGDCPDLHLFPILLPLAPAGCEPPQAGYVLAAGVMAPDSRGSLRLASADPASAPLIDPGFLREQRDTDRLEQGTRLIREAVARSGLAQAGHAERWPGPDVRSSTDLRTYIRRTVGSYYHPAGTCRMGIDAGAVTDLRLQVHGVAGLRVADASVLPVLPNAHPNATVLAIAERAAELISGPAARA